MAQSQYLPSNRSPLIGSHRANSDIKVNENAVSYLPSPVTQKALLNLPDEAKKNHSPYQSYNGFNSERSYGQKGSYVEFLAKPINNSSLVDPEPIKNTNPMTIFESPIQGQRSTYQTESNERRSSPRRSSRRSRNPYDRNLSPFIKRDQVIMDVLLEDYYGGSQTTRERRPSAIYSQDSDESVKRSPVQVNKPYGGLMKPSIKIDEDFAGNREYNVRATYDTPNKLPNKVVRRRGVSISTQRSPKDLVVVEKKCLAPMDIDASPLVRKILYLKVSNEYHSMLDIV